MRYKDGSFEDYFFWKYVGKKRKIVNVNGIKFKVNFEKSLSKLFEDCTMVSNKALNGAYKLEEASLRQLYDDYSVCK